MRAFIGLGSNLGDRVAHLHSALAQLEDLPDTRVVRRSSCYETTPVGNADLPFINAIAELESALNPEVLMAHLLEIEARHGRLRSVQTGNRTLDLDFVLAFDGGQSVEIDIAGQDRTRLQVPHPRARERDFVLAPLAELDPDLPIEGVPCREWLARLKSEARTVLGVVP
jgi:2-amino-4-hydroxy-6-hydroxymethyldihydropteridine diphosphokinase